MILNEVVEAPKKKKPITEVVESSPKVTKKKPITESVE